MYDTLIPEKKMICAINAKNQKYECLFVTTTIDISCYDQYSYSANFEITDIKISIKLSSANDECTVCNNIFDEEGLICCGSDNKIKCTRLIQYSPKNSFDINYEGVFTKFFIFSDSSTFIDIFFQKSEQNFGYRIYKPTCVDFELETDAYGQDYKNIDDCFENRTNTNYYIYFINVPETYGYISVNNVGVNQGIDNKILLDGSPSSSNTIGFTSQNSQLVDDFKIKYVITIEETYSSECTINLSIRLPCYESCQKCSKNMYESEPEHHNCLEDKCKTDYFPSPSTLTNCYKEEEKELNWFLNTTIKRFQLCHTNCSSCSGPNLDDCLSCYSASTKPELAYLYNNKCLNECPKGTYPSIQSEGYYLCKPCYQNCQTCNEGETYNDLSKLNNMNCLTCKKDINTNDENTILIDSYCFPIKAYTEEKIIFDISVLNIEETEKTCLDYGKAIIQGEYKCITKESNYYYVLSDNENTGIIKKCDEACESCNGEKNQITQDTNCINCVEGYYKTEDSNTNFILENLIPQNYLKNNTDEIYYKCHRNCKRCNDYYDANNNIMNCLECINDYYFVDGTNNCYNNTILEEGYYFDDFTINENEEPTYKRCYEKCQTCNNTIIESNMNCI